MDPQLKENLTRRETWLRGLFMILFAVIYSLTEIVITAVVVFQFLTLLVTGSRNARLLSFGRQLATFAYQVLTYLTFNTDRRPWPLDPWPAAEGDVAGDKPAEARDGGA